MSRFVSPFVHRWWTYQAERFPVVAHGILILAFSSCAVSLSRMLRGEENWPPLGALAVAFVSCFVFLLQLRIADEFKDAAEDARWRPYRPVPRGLVSLRELGVLFALGAVLQLVVALVYHAALIGVLLVTWIYLAAMSREFFAREWLVARPTLYLVTHMGIMPLIDFYATATDWMVAGARVPAGLGWFLAASFFNGMVIEFGRKIRTPHDEEEGVRTYSVLWGRGPAIFAWWSVLLATALCAVMVARHIEHAFLVGTTLGVGLAIALVLGIVVLREPRPGRGRWIEHASGAWTLALYLSLGIVPHLLGGRG